VNQLKKGILAILLTVMLAPLPAMCAMKSYCATANVFGGIVYEHGKAYMHLVSTDQGSQIYSAMLPVMHNFSDDKILFYVYKSDLDDGVALKFAPDNTCSINFLVNKQRIAFDGYVKKVNITQ